MSTYGYRGLTIGAEQVLSAFLLDQPMKWSWAPKIKDADTCYFRTNSPYPHLTNRRFYFLGDVLFSYGMPLVVKSRVGNKVFYFVNSDESPTMTTSRHINRTKRTILATIPEQQRGELSFTLAHKEGINLTRAMGTASAPYQLPLTIKCDRYCSHTLATVSQGKSAGQKHHSFTHYFIRQGECSVRTENGLWLFGKTRDVRPVAYRAKLLENTDPSLDTESLLETIRPAETPWPALNIGPWYFQPTGFHSTRIPKAKWWKKKLQLPPDSIVKVQQPVFLVNEKLNQGKHWFKARVAQVSVLNADGTTLCDYTFVSGSVCYNGTNGKLDLHNSWHTVHFGNVDNYETRK